MMKGVLAWGARQRPFFFGGAFLGSKKTFVGTPSTASFSLVLGFKSEQ